jgi:hypothetical protein
VPPGGGSEQKCNNKWARDHRLLAARLGSSRRGPAPQAAREAALGPIARHPRGRRANMDEHFGNWLLRFSLSCK